MGPRFLWMEAWKMVDSSARLGSCCSYPWSLLQSVSSTHAINLSWLAYKLEPSGWRSLPAVGHACQYNCLYAFPLIDSEIISVASSFLNLKWVSRSQYLMMVVSSILTILFFPAEMVLSLLLESFEFTPSKKDIFWQMTNLASPTVVGEGTQPQLPIVVKLVKPIL